ncbi:MAG: EAL domain-containing protein [Parvibaculum sp.]
MNENTSPLTKAALDSAFNDGHFATVFQPKLSLIDGRTLGVETYIRWHHPELGTLLPGEFLDFLIAHRRMGDLTDLVLHEAARAASLWRSERRHWSVAVNLSVDDLEQSSLVDHLSDLLTAYAIPTEALAIDIPESALADDDEQHFRALEKLRQAGFHVALDTAGINLLPVARITSQYFSELKIGGTSLIKFSRSVANAGGGLIAERLKAASRYGLTVTATRVEDIDTVKPLADMGFTAVQGSFFRHPDTIEGLQTWSSDWLIPVLSDERPVRTDTIARARATLADPDLLLFPEEEPVDGEKAEASEGPALTLPVPDDAPPLNRPKRARRQTLTAREDRKQIFFS